MKSVRILGAAIAATGLVTLGVAAQAVTHSMSGSIIFLNPSTISAERGPIVRGASQATFTLMSRTTPFTSKVTIMVVNNNLASATVNQTAPQGDITVPISVWRVDGWPNLTTPTPVPQAAVGGGQLRSVPAANGSQFRTFPAFPGVAQLTQTHFTTQPTALHFFAGGGAAAANTIDWCPKITPCLTYTNGNVAQARILIGGNGYGGTVKLIRNSLGNVFFVPKTSPPISISKNPNPVPGVTWTQGITNLATITDNNPAGKIYQGGSLDTQGVVSGLGVYVGAGFDPPDGQATGFQMTTGSIFVIDATPPTPGAGPFSSTISGGDTRSATNGNGNITLVGGAVAYGGVSGNNFFRVTILDMTLPEPQTAAGLAAGVACLVGLAVLRRRLRS